MKTNTKWMVAAGAVALLYLYNAFSSDLAEKVISEEITGVVVEKGSGKPVANAVVAIRFERHNTGHGSPFCFRSMATETDANGRFRFEPWSQENTLANFLRGEIVAYKKGYAIPRHEAEHIAGDRRSLLGIRWSKNLHISKTERRVEVREWGGTVEERMGSLEKTVGDFDCGLYGQSGKRLPQENDTKILALAIREEIVASPLADRRDKDSLSSSYTHRSWIEEVLKRYER